jgi:hypothetical protein
MCSKEELKMDARIRQNLEFRQQIIELGYEIAGDIDHAECFYDEDMLKDFISNLDKLKSLAREYFISNKSEMEEDENESIKGL